MICWEWDWRKIIVCVYMFYYTWNCMIYATCPVFSCTLDASLLWRPGSCNKHRIQITQKRANNHHCNHLYTIRRWESTNKNVLIADKEGISAQVLDLVKARKGDRWCNNQQPTLQWLWPEKALNPMNCLISYYHNRANTPYDQGQYWLLQPGSFVVKCPTLCWSGSASPLSGLTPTLNLEHMGCKMLSVQAV